MAFFRKKSNTSNSSTSTADAKAKLENARIELDKHLVRLEKTQKVNLSKHCARVFVILDRSGSMSGQYRCGDVQNVLTRLLPLALKFDDNGELEVYVFDEKCDKVPVPLTIQNYQTYVEEEIMAKGYGPRDCGTNYAPAIRKTDNDFNDGSPYPAFGMLITDGACWDESDTDTAIRNSSEHKIFYQCVGIGRDNFNYLRKLDDLDGRKVDNTAFIKVSDFADLTDEQLYAKLLEQYPQWLKDMNLQ